MSAPPIVTSPSGASGCASDCSVTQSPSGSIPSSGAEIEMDPPANTRAVAGGGSAGAALRAGSGSVTVIVTVLTVCTGASAVLLAATAT